jgi:predicted nucleic acid-binding protein
MSATYTIDATVFLEGFNPYGPRHRESRQLLEQLQDGATPIIAPTLLLTEVTAALSLGRADKNLTRRFAAALRRLPHLMLVPLDENLAAQAAEMAALHRLRGSDAVYAAVATRFGSMLVTLDPVQREGVAKLITTRYPAEALDDRQSTAWFDQLL